VHNHEHQGVVAVGLAAIRGGAWVGGLEGVARMVACPSIIGWTVCG
jgi:hypothetical protein